MAKIPRRLHAAAAAVCRKPPLADWVNTTKCEGCSAGFTLLRRRHHCRSCGLCVCAACSPSTLEVGRACKACASTRHKAAAVPLRDCRGRKRKATPLDDLAAEVRAELAGLRCAVSNDRARYARAVRARLGQLRARAAALGEAGSQNFERVCLQLEVDSVLAAADPLLGKFVQTPARQFSQHAPEEALWGIWTALGIAEDSTQQRAILADGVAEIKREWAKNCDLDDHARFKYVFEMPAQHVESDHELGKGGRRDTGHSGLTLADFCAKDEAREAGLETAHVLALRLYTSNSFYRVNSPLRDGAERHPFAATAFYVHDGIAKLSRGSGRGATPVVQPTTFYRGLENMAVSDAFSSAGGTERGCMSTTTNRRVAEEQFAKVGVNPCPLLLKIDAGASQCVGASVVWLSMYPEEEEWLFPPLTYLRPVGAPVDEPAECGADATITVLTVRPTFWRWRPGKADRDRSGSSSHSSDSESDVGRLSKHTRMRSGPQAFLAAYSYGAGGYDCDEQSAKRARSSRPSFGSAGRGYDT